MSKRDEERERRLAESLRENLKRRKAQGRARDASPEDGAVSPSAPEPSTPPR